MPRPPAITLDDDTLELIPGYVQNQVKLLSEVQQASQAFQWDTLKKLSHKVKGSARSYGFNRLGEIAQALEQAALSEDRDETTRWVSEWTLHLDEIQDYIQKEVLPKVKVA